jgi:hypothetical protein
LGALAEDFSDRNGFQGSFMLQTLRACLVRVGD